MHQSVLMHADIYKCAKVNHIAHGAFQLHAGLQVLQPHHIAAQQRFGQAVAHIAPRLAQLGHNIHQGRFAHAKCFAQGFGAAALHPHRQVLHRVRADLFGVTAAGFQQALGGGVAFGVDGGCIQRVLGTRQAQKACALFKCLGAKALDLFQLRTGGKRALLLTPSHNIFSGSVGNAGHTGQQRGGRRVQIHANAVHAVFHHTVQRFVQALLGHIMLVLAHAHGLGVNFNQFGQRVLQAARNGNRAAQVDVILRELLRRQLGRRIHRSTGFTDDHILQVQPLFLGQFTDYGGGKLLGFMPGGAVADGHDLHPVFQHHALDGFLGLIHPLEFRHRVYHVGIQHLAGGVHHGNLAAHAVAGVQAHHGFAADGRLQQQLAQILAKHSDGTLGGLGG